MKLTPSEGQDMMIWFRPENRSIAFTVFYHFILPVPGTGLKLFFLMAENVQASDYPGKTLWFIETKSSSLQILSPTWWRSEPVSPKQNAKKEI